MAGWRPAFDRVVWLVQKLHVVRAEGFTDDNVLFSSRIAVARSPTPRVFKE